MTYTQQDGARDRQPDRAAIFIDYDNLYRFLAHTTGSRSVPVALVSEMLEGIQRSLLEDRSVQSAVARAYADFASLEQTGERIQRSLYLQGVEPHYVPGARDEQAVELQLCVDAMDLLHHRSDISTFVLLTGRRIYLPLVRMMRRYGRRVLVVGLNEPSRLDDIPQLDGDWYFPARDLLSATSRRQLTSVDSDASVARDESIDVLDDPILIRTLEIIEEHFGQYEEVYLTPLLRKLSDVLDDQRYDPKNLIGELEEHEAVRLEKRQGFPHDYTVLILEDGHPAVDRVRSGSQRSSYYYEEPSSGYEEFDEADLDESYRYNGEEDDGEVRGAEPDAVPSYAGGHVDDHIDEEESYTDADRS